MKTKKTWHDHLLNHAVGKQDERERLQIMQRLSNVFVGVYWLSALVAICAYVFDWEMGKNAIFVWLILAYVLFGHKKINNLSDETLPENQSIHPQNAVKTQQKALHLACVKGVLFAVMSYLAIVSQYPQYAWGMVCFAAMIGMVVTWFLYAAAKKEIQKILTETED